MSTKVYKVRFSPLAEKELRQYWRHIAQDNVAAADKFFDTVKEKANNLSEFPERGVLRNDLRDGVHVLVVGKYLIFYVINEDVVQVLRLIHGSMDLTTAFSATTM